MFVNFDVFTHLVSRFAKVVTFEDDNNGPRDLIMIVVIQLTCSPKQIINAQRDNQVLSACGGSRAVHLPAIIYLMCFGYNFCFESNRIGGAGKEKPRRAN